MFNRILKSDKPRIAVQYCTVAIGVTTIAKDRAGRKLIMDKLKKMTNTEVVGNKALWETKSAICQAWLVENMLSCLEMASKPSSARRNRGGKKKKNVRSESLKAGTARKVLLKLWKAVMDVMKEKEITEEEMLKLVIEENGEDTTVEKRMTKWLENQPLDEWAGRDDEKWVGIMKNLTKQIRKGSDILDNLSPEEKRKEQRKKDLEYKRALKKKEKNDEQRKNGGPSNVVDLEQEKEGGKAPPKPKPDEVAMGENSNKTGVEGASEKDEEEKSETEKGEELESAHADTTTQRRPRRERKNVTYAEDEEEVENDELKNQPKKATNAATRPPGYDHEGIKGRMVKNQTETYQPFWLLKDEKDYLELFSLVKPWGKKKLSAPGEETGLLTDSQGFEIIGTADEGRIIVFKMPKMRDGGWLTVTWESNENCSDGEFLWYEATYVPIGSKVTETVRLLEDYQNNWIYRDPPFVLDTEPRIFAVEYDFIRNPPIPDKNYTPACRSQRVLRCLGFRMPHRALVHLDMNDIHDIRNFMGAYFLQKDAPQVINAAQLLSTAGEATKSHIEALYEEILLTLFRGYRDLLDERGYIIFDGIMNPNGMKNAENIRGYESLKDKKPPGKDWEEYAAFFETFAPTVAQMEKNKIPEQTYDIFSVIRDDNGKTKKGGKKVGPLPIKKGCRLTSLRRAVTDLFEEMVDKKKGLSLLRSKTKKEVMVMQLMHWLRLEEHSFDATSPTDNNKNSTARADEDILRKRREVPRLYCPDTGSRVIMNSSKEGKEQIPHIDYCIPETASLDSRTGALKYPPYFAEVTTANPTPLWILSNSHKTVGKLEDERTLIDTYHNLPLIYVPAWSIIITRGDITHAGGSGEMAAKVEDKYTSGSTEKAEGAGRCTRSHLYIGREGIGLPDSINDQHTETSNNEKDDKQIPGEELLRTRLITK